VIPSSDSEEKDFVRADNEMLFSEENLSEKEVLNNDMFTAPSFDDFDETLTPHLNLEYDNSWILIWIFKYQERFRLSDVAVNSLIGFLNILLNNVDSHRFKNFPSTSYMARKLLEIKKNYKSFAVCSDCNKLYNYNDIIPKNQTEFNGFKCTHIEFPNHPRHDQ